MKIIKFLFIVLAGIFPFGQLTRIPLSFFNLPEIRIYLIDMLIFAIFDLWLIWHLKNKKRFYYPKLWREQVIFFGFLLFSLIINIRNYKLIESFVGLAYFLRYLLYGTLYWIISDLRINQNFFNKNFWIKCLCWWSISLPVTGIIQYLLLPDVRFLYSYNWDLHYYRLVGLFLDPNFIGILLVLGILYLLSLLVGKIRKISDIRDNFWQLFLLIFMGVTFLLTYSRSSYLALIASIIFLLYLKKKLKYLFLFLFLFLFFILLLPRPGGEGVKLERLTSAVQRIESWQKAIKIWQKYPLFGVGFNNYRYAQRKLGYLNFENWEENHAGAGVDNSFLFILVTTGIFGFLSFINFWLKVFLEFIKSEDISVKFLVLGSLIAIFVHSFFINSLFYPWVLIWIWFLLGFMECKTI